MLKDEILKQREKLSVDIDGLDEEIKRVKRIAEKKAESIVKKEVEEINKTIIYTLSKEDHMYFLLDEDDNFKGIYSDGATWKSHLFNNVSKRMIRQLNASNKIEIKIDNHYYRPMECFVYKFSCKFYDITYTETYVHEPDSSHSNVCIEGVINKTLFEEYLKNEGLKVKHSKKGLIINV